MTSTMGTGRAMLVVAAVGMLLAAAPLARGQATGGAAPAPASTQAARIALIDIDAVFTNYEKTKEMSERVKEMARLEDDKIQALTAELQKMQKELEASPLNPEGPGMQDRVVKFQQKKVELEAAQQLAVRRVTLQRLKLTWDLYQEVIAGAGEVARAKGYSMVMSKDNINNTVKIEDFRSVEALLDFLRVRKVIWFDGNHDITQETLSYLNRKFQAEKAAATPKP